MEISAHTEHKWYNPDCLRCTVYLNEVRQTECVTASEEEGFVEVYYRDENGRMVIDPNDSGCLHLKRLTGKVRIEMRKPDGS